MEPTKNSKPVKDSKGGMLGKAKRALAGRQQQLNLLEAQYVGKKSD